MSRSKSLRAADKKVSKTDLFSVKKAIALMIELNTTKFDATAEVHLNLGIDPRHADQQIRSTLTLPHGTGKSVKVAVFCSDDKVAEAKAAGAIEAGGIELVDKVIKGWTDFDIAVATPDMMKNLAKAARVLGPKGLMPNPKTGTVTSDVEKTVKALLGGRIEIRNDKNGIIHTIFGKISFGASKLEENLEAVLKTIKEVKPSGQKGNYIKTFTINSTMGTGIRITLQEEA